MSVTKRRPRCSAPPTKPPCATPATTGFTTPTSLPLSTNAFPYPILPLQNKSLFAISVRRNELSCSVSKTEQFCAEIVMFQFMPQTNIPRNITGFFLQGLNSLLPPLSTHPPLHPQSLLYPTLAILFLNSSLNNRSRTLSLLLLQI